MLASTVPEARVRSGTLTTTYGDIGLVKGGPSDSVLSDWGQPGKHHFQPCTPIDHAFIPTKSTPTNRKVVVVSPTDGVKPSTAEPAAQEKPPGWGVPDKYAFHTQRCTHALPKEPQPTPGLTG